MKVNDRFTVEISKLNHQAEGISRINGQVVFVPGALPGETAEIEITAVKKKLAYARLIQVLQASPDRVIPSCQHFGVCGACHLQHLNYPRQLEIKKQILIEHLYGLDLPTQINFYASPKDWHYRYRASLPVRANSHGFEMGYYLPDSHQILDIEACPVLLDTFMPIIKGFKRCELDFETRQTARHLLLLSAYPHSEIQLALVLNTENLKIRTEWESWIKAQNWNVQILFNFQLEETNAITGNHWNETPAAKGLYQSLSALDLPVSLKSFSQVNPQIAEKISEQIFELGKEFFRTSEHLIELYGGIGFFSKVLRSYFKTLKVVESNPQSAALAQKFFPAAQFFSETCADFLRQHKTELKEDSKQSVVMFNPPRKGLEKSVVDDLLEIQPAQMIYLSCNPASLARDLKRLCVRYQITHLSGWDMFPQTYHFESLVFLSLKA